MDGVDGDKGDKGDKGDPGTPGEKGDPGPSNAYADGPNSATLDNNLSTVASVEVPAGSYVVSASVRVANGFTSNANGLPTCFVATGSGGSIPDGNIYQSELQPRTGTTSSIQTISFTRPVTAGPGATISLFCYNAFVSTADLSARAGRLTAVKVGALDEQ